MPRRLRVYLAALVLLLALGITACGGDDDASVRAPAETSSTTTATTVTPASTTPTSSESDGKVITYQGVTINVPDAWPVYDLASDPTRCVRADEHAVFLGEQGATPDCPAQVLGRTETVQLEQLDARSQLDADRATQATTVNGIAARIDPEPDTNGALTVVLTDQQVVLIVTYGSDRSLADATLKSLALA
jgi:hypothetical protein